MNQTTPFFGKWESNFKNASVAKLHCGIPNYFSRMTSFNQTERNNVDYSIIPVSVSSQWVPILKLLP